jgi:hypothetical protein
MSSADKFLKLEIHAGPDGQVSAFDAERVRAKMYEEVAERVPESHQQEARGKVDALIGELLREGPAALSLKTVLTAITSAIETLDPLPRAVRNVAQTQDAPLHIFNLGGAASELIAARAMLEMAKETIETHLACEHCKHTPEPEGPLS